MSENIVRIRFQFFGQVQGVGFRYRAYHAANALGLTGWVENQHDGSVLCEVQGERSAIDQMLASVASGTYIFFTDILSTKLEPKNDERSFEIRGY